jgi:hypothetical protein
MTDGLAADAALLSARRQAGTPAEGHGTRCGGAGPIRRRAVREETLIDRQTREISSKLRCVVCQGLSLQDSPSQLAQEMRAIVREKLEEGMTPDEVKAYFVEKYGEWVLLQPDPAASTSSSTSCRSRSSSAAPASSSSRRRSWTPARGGFEATDPDEEETKRTRPS